MLQEYDPFGLGQYNWDNTCSIYVTLILHPYSLCFNMSFYNAHNTFTVTANAYSYRNNIIKHPWSYSLSPPMFLK